MPDYSAKGRKDEIKEEKQGSEMFFGNHYVEKTFKKRKVEHDILSTHLNPTSVARFLRESNAKSWYQKCQIRSFIYCLHKI